MLRDRAIKRSKPSGDEGSGEKYPVGGVRVQAQAKAATLRRFWRLFPSVADFMSFSQEIRREVYE